MRLLTEWCDSVRHIGSLPDLPRPSSVREKAADFLFIVLRMVAKFGILIGAVAGMFHSGTTGLFVGTIAGALVGLWVHSSLGLRKGKLTHGFFVRMQERAMSSKPRLLEAFVELVRGTSLTITQSRMLASAYEGLHHHLQTCDSEIERKRLFRNFKREVFAAIYGNRSFPLTETDDDLEVLETRNANVDV